MTSPFRVGLGYDLHRLEEGRPLVLGGVTIPYAFGLAGHSDADVLAHAVTDAILGAVNLGNIGMLFPDTDPANKDLDSMIFLREAMKRLGEAGYALVNVDTVIVAQRPKLNPYTARMAARLAAEMGLPEDAVSVKPKTNEHMGPEGRGEAISAQAVVLVQRAADG